MKWTMDRGRVYVSWELFFIVFGILTLAALLLTQGCGHVNWANWTEWWDQGGSELLATPTPTPVPTPAPDVWHEPEYSFMQYDSGLPIGVCVTTGHIVPGQGGQGCYGSISCSWIQFQDCITGEVTQIAANTTQWTSPGGVDNWGVDNWAKADTHWYTTAHQINDAGYNPTADGTRRGSAIVEWNRLGDFHVWVHYRATGNRGTAWLGITQDCRGQEVTYWYEWDQRGNGPYVVFMLRGGGGSECLTFILPEGVVKTFEPFPMVMGWYKREQPNHVGVATYIQARTEDQARMVYAVANGEVQDDGALWVCMRWR